MSLFRRTPPPPKPEPEGPLAEFITVSIPGEHFSRWTPKPGAQLDAFIDALTEFMVSIDLGEMRLAESVPNAARLYLDAPNAEEFAAKLLPWLRQQSFAKGARVLIDDDMNEDGRKPREVVI